MAGAEDKDCLAVIETPTAVTVGLLRHRGRMHGFALQKISILNFQGLRRVFRL